MAVQLFTVVELLIRVISQLTTKLALWIVGIRIKGHLNILHLNLTTIGFLVRVVRRFIWRWVMETAWSSKRLSFTVCLAVKRNLGVCSWNCSNANLTNDVFFTQLTLSQVFALFLIRIELWLCKCRFRFITVVPKWLLDLILIFLWSWINIGIKFCVSLWQFELWSILIQASTRQVFVCRSSIFIAVILFMPQNLPGAVDLLFLVAVSQVKTFLDLIGIAIVGSRGEWKRSFINHIKIVIGIFFGLTLLLDALILVHIWLLNSSFVFYLILTLEIVLEIVRVVVVLPVLFILILIPFLVIILSLIIVLWIIIIITVVIHLPVAVTILVTRRLVLIWVTGLLWHYVLGIWVLIVLIIHATNKLNNWQLCVFIKPNQHSRINLVQIRLKVK